MLLVDYRQGSAELLEPLRKLGLPAESGDIAADLAWEGYDAGQLVMVGTEFKKLGELIQALRTERLQGYQIPKMREAEFKVCYLLVEGEWRVDPKSKRLLRRSGRHEWKVIEGSMSVDELRKRLHTLYIEHGVVTLRTAERHETLQEISALYHSWANKDRQSHIAIYQPPQLVPISEFRAFVTRFEGIGLKTSKAIETHFRGSLRAAVNATKAEWMKVPGIGPKLAQHIVNVCEGRST